MPKFIIDNITLEQAKALAGWYEGQGEQDSEIWLEEEGLESVYIDVNKKTVINKEEETVTIFARN
jgi:predicted Zn-dependent protease with MMP-like domain